jgi:hypothetical protein
MEQACLRDRQVHRQPTSFTVNGRKPGHRWTTGAHGQRGLISIWQSRWFCRPGKDKHSSKPTHAIFHRDHHNKH